MHRPTSAVLAALAVAFSAASLTGSTPATASSSSSATAATHVVVVGAEQDSACLNPVLAPCSAFWTTSIVGIALPGAYRVANDLSYQPMLVDHVDVATAPVFSLTYHLKTQAVWSDGVPVSADDLIFTWQTLMNPSIDVPSRAGYDQITQAVKLDAKTVRFEFMSRVASWRSLFPTVLPQHALAGYDVNVVWQAGIVDPATGTPIGAGPFLVTSYVKGQGFRLTRNPRWWGPHAPYLDEIDFAIITDTNSEIQAMLGGEVDVIAPSPQTGLSVLEGQPGIGMQANEGGLVEHLDFNVGTPGRVALLGEPWFRQAVAYAIDRQAIATAVWGAIDPAIRPAQNLVYLSQQPEYQPSFAGYVRDTAKVAELMEGHGCVKGVDGIYSCGGTRASFTITTTAGNQRRATELTMMQAELRDAGIEALADVRPSTIVFGTVLPTGAFDAAIFAWVIAGDPTGVDAIYGCGGGSNYGRYCSAQVTSLLVGSNTELDPTARADDVDQAMAIMATDMPSLPLYRAPSFLFYNTAVHGLLNNTSSQGPFWNTEDWRGAVSTLTVGKTGGGTGSVSSTPAGIDCGGSCSADFADSTPVTLTATAAAGSHFDGWQGDCTGTGACTVVLAGARNVTAVFSVVDTTPPVVTVPGAIVADATSPSGAVVTYSASASDPDDAVASLTCAPASGGTFAIGTTTVSCTATDSHGNTGTASFTVHVRGAAEQLAELAAAVRGVGPGKSLSATIAVAQWFLAHDQRNGACLTLTAFNLEVRAQAGKKIPKPQATELIADANRIKAVLGCRK